MKTSTLDMSKITHVEEIPFPHYQHTMTQGMPLIS